MSGQFPAQQPQLAARAPGNQLSGYFNQSSDATNPFSSIVSAPAPAPSQLTHGDAEGADRSMQPSVTSSWSEPGTSHEELVPQSGPGFFDSLPTGGQVPQQQALLPSHHPPSFPSQFPSVADQPQQQPPRPSDAGRVAGGTSSLFASGSGSSQQQDDFFSSFQHQSVPPSSSPPAPASYKSPSAPSTSLLEVLTPPPPSPPPEQQKSGSCPSTGVIQVLQPSEPQNQPGTPEGPASMTEPPPPPPPSLPLSSSGHPSLSSGHPSLSSDLHSLPSDPFPPYGSSSVSDEQIRSAHHHHPSQTNAERMAHTGNVETNADLPRPPSNADIHSRTGAYGDPFLSSFQPQTNADPGFAATSNTPRLKTNLQSNLGVARDNVSPVVSPTDEARSLPLPPPADATPFVQGAPPPLIGTATSAPHMQGTLPLSSEPGPAGGTERPPSTTSSLSHSISSLLDSQDDFTSKGSPIRLLAPAPFTHEPLPPVGPPTSLMGPGEVQLGALSLAPPAPLPAVASAHVSSSVSEGAMASSVRAGSSVTGMQEALATSFQQEPVEQDRGMSNSGTVRLLAEASAEENVVAVGAKTGKAWRESVSPLVVGSGSKGTSAAASVSPDSNSKGEGSLNGWEIVDGLAESGAQITGQAQVQSSSAPFYTQLPPPPSADSSVQQQSPDVAASQFSNTIPSPSEAHFASPASELQSHPASVHPTCTGGVQQSAANANLTSLAPVPGHTPPQAASGLLPSPDMSSTCSDTTPAGVPTISPQAMPAAQVGTSPPTGTHSYHATPFAPATSQADAEVPLGGPVTSQSDMHAHQQGAGHNLLTSGVPTGHVISMPPVHPPIQSSQWHTVQRDSADQPSRADQDGTSSVAVMSQSPQPGLEVAGYQQAATDSTPAVGGNVTAQVVATPTVVPIMATGGGVSIPPPPVGLVAVTSAPPPQIPSAVSIGQSFCSDSQPLVPATATSSGPLGTGLMPRLDDLVQQGGKGGPESLFQPVVTSTTASVVGEKESMPLPTSSKDVSQDTADIVEQAPEPQQPSSHHNDYQADYREPSDHSMVPHQHHHQQQQQQQQQQQEYEPYREAGYAYDARHRPASYTADPHQEHYHSRPHSRAMYGYPHDPAYPPPPPHHHRPHPHYQQYPPDPRDRHHHHHPPYHPGGGGYDPYAPYPPYGDPYRHHPRDPYYDPYGYGGYDPRDPGHYHRYPPHHHDYQPPPPPQRGFPPYDRDPYDVAQDPQRYPPETYRGGEGYAGGVPPESYTSEADLDAQSVSVIDGPSEPRFEESQVMESPSIGRMPPHGGRDIPLESTIMEYPQQQQQQQHQQQQPAHFQQPGGYPHAQEVEGYGHDHYYQPAYGEEYSNYGTYQDTGYYDSNAEQTQQEEQQQQQQEWPTATEPAMPPPPARETPEIFSCPHLRASFCFGGQLLTVLPGNVRAGDRPLVELLSVREVLLSSDEGSREFVEAVDESPGPFIPGDTPKSSVVGFASKQAQLCREKRQSLGTDGDGGGGDQAEQLEDEVLFWEFLVLLCQQNGSVMPSDVVDLLMRDRALDFKSATHFGAQGQVGALDALRQLLLSGRKKDALDFACSKSLWGHALMLASRMDDQSRTYVVNRFTASLTSTDPLNTFYTLLLGRTPSSVKPEGLSRAGDWRPHLSMILANKVSKAENTSVVTLGDSLMAKGRLHAAHLCYHLADVHFGCYGDKVTRYSLLGVDHTGTKVGDYPRPRDLHMMEVFEYAMSLTNQDFSLPAFQLFKLLHVYRLAEYGFPKVALRYCEQIGLCVARGMDKYLPTFLTSLVGLSVRLHHLTWAEYGCVEAEPPSWLGRLQRAVEELLSSDYSPNLLSPSPAFSSVSQTYSSHSNQPHQQLVIGLQRDSPHLTVPQVSSLSTTSRTKEGSALATDREAKAGGVSSGDVAGFYPGQAASQLVPVAGEGGAVVGGVVSAGQGQEGGQEAVQQDVGQPFSQGVPTQQSDGQFQQQSVGLPAFTAGPTGDGVGSGQDPGGYYYPPSSSSLQGQGEGFGVSGAADGPPQINQPESSQQGFGVSQQPPVSHSADSQLVGSNSDTGGYFGQSQSMPDYGAHTTAPPTHNYHQPDPTSLHSQHNAPPTSTGGPPSSAASFPPPATVSAEPPTSRQQEPKPAESTAGSDNKEEPKNKPPAKSGSGGWGRSILNYFVPKKKNQAHLPDDKNPSIVWDEEKKKWVNMDNDGEETEDLAPPPTDSELNKTAPGPQLTTPLPSEGVDGVAISRSSEAAAPPPAPTGGGNKYSRQGSTRGRAGARSKYVDVLNTGGSSGGGTGPQPGPAPPPGPGPPPMMLGGTMGGAAQPFSGSFFVPQPVPDDDGTQTPTPLNPTNSTPSEAATSHPHSGGQAPPSGAESAVTSVPDSGTAASYQQGSNPSDQHISSMPSQLPPQQQSGYDGGVQGQSSGVVQGQSSGMVQGQSSGVVPGQSWGVAGGQDSLPVQSQQQQQVTSTSQSAQSANNGQPQFFNPSAFARVGGYPGSADTQEDAMSSVSLMSESSQEVSRYMNTRGPASAGYNRLRQGIRGTGGYPAIRGGAANQQKPHPGSTTGPPPVGHS